MNLKDCIDNIELLLKQQNRNHKDSHAQMLYERGYLTGLLARLMMTNPMLRGEIIEKIKHK